MGSLLLLGSRPTWIMNLRMLCRSLSYSKHLVVLRFSCFSLSLLPCSRGVLRPRSAYPTQCCWGSASCFMSSLVPGFNLLPMDGWPNQRCNREYSGVSTAFSLQPVFPGFLIAVCIFVLLFGIRCLSSAGGLKEIYTISS